jgi:hypothetical protein
MLHSLTVNILKCNHCSKCSSHGSIKGRINQGYFLLVLGEQGTTLKLPTPETSSYVKSEAWPDGKTWVRKNLRFLLNIRYNRDLGNDFLSLINIITHWQPYPRQTTWSVPSLGSLRNASCLVGCADHKSITCTSPPGGGLSYLNKESAEVFHQIRVRRIARLGPKPNMFSEISPRLY